MEYEHNGLDIMRIIFLKVQRRLSQKFVHLEVFLMFRVKPSPK